MGEHSNGPLHEIVCSDQFYEQVQAKLKDPNDKIYGGRTLLHIAARSSEDNSMILQLLLDKGAQVNAATVDGYTPLHFAVWCRKRPTVLALIQAEASVNSKDFLGRTALHFAVTKRWPNPPGPLFNLSCDIWIVERLLCHPEINPNPVDEMGETPLMWAIKERQSDAVRLLLKKGANPNIPNKDNQTSLHMVLSSRNPSYDIVILLLTNGAGIYHEDKFGQTPMDILIQNVCDDETLLFASRCVFLIPIRYQIRGSLERKLERIPMLFNQLRECCKEVRLMKKVAIHDKFTLYDFASNCFQARDEIPVRAIYVRLVEILLTGLFKKYFECIFNCISFQELCRVLEISTGCWFSLEILPPHVSKFTLFNAIELLYEENIELNMQLRWYKALLMKRI